MTPDRISRKRHASILVALCTLAATSRASAQELRQKAGRGPPVGIPNPRPWYHHYISSKQQTESQEIQDSSEHPAAIGDSDRGHAAPPPANTPWYLLHLQSAPNGPLIGVPEAGSPRPSAQPPTPPPGGKKTAPHVEAQALGVYSAGLNGRGNLVAPGSRYGYLLNAGNRYYINLSAHPLVAADEATDPWVTFQLYVGAFRNSDDWVLLNYDDKIQLWYANVRIGNVLAPRVALRLGTLQAPLASLRLFVAQWTLAQALEPALGASLSYQGERFDFEFGLGDRGIYRNTQAYAPLLVAGGYVRYRTRYGLLLGIGGELRFEPNVPTALGVGEGAGPYESFLNGELARNAPSAPRGHDERHEASWKLIGQLEARDHGDIERAMLLANVQQRHPASEYVEQQPSGPFVMYVPQLTDEQYELNLGAEITYQLTNFGLRGTVSAIAGHYWDNDAFGQVTGHNLDFVTVLTRIETPIVPAIGWLGEAVTSYEKWSTQAPNAPSRWTWQLKTGLSFRLRSKTSASRATLDTLYGVGMWRPLDQPVPYFIHATMFQLSLGFN